MCAGGGGRVMGVWRTWRGGGGGTQGKGDLLRRNPAAAVEASAVRANVSELSPMP